MRMFLSSVIAAGLMAAMPASAAEQRVSIDVGEMTCPSCSFTVSRSMKRVPSVEIVDFRPGEAFGEGVFVVTFDDAKATAEMIVEAVNAIGYPARLLAVGGS
ncbi:MAG: periplasmic mercury ion-binding protein [Alphaproteobacteria bacterium]|nr:MAG: periplasmic mercury ion-binding protein [Alphaproteobacteria bacterium]